MSRASKASNGSSARITKEQQAVLKAVALSGFLASALGLMRCSPVGDFLQTTEVDTLQQQLSRFHIWAPGIYVALGAVVIAIGAPRSLVSLLGGSVFGLGWGTTLAMTAAFLGSLSVFGMTRWLGRPLFKIKVSRFLQSLEAYCRRNGFLTVILLRQLPLTCFLVNVILGLTPIRTRTVVAASLIGLLPETLIFVMFGSSLQESFALRVSMASSLLILLVIGATMLYARSSFAKEFASRFNRSRIEQIQKGTP